MDNQHTPLTEDQLDDIEARAAHLTEYATLTDGPLQDDADRLTGTDVPVMAAEIRRLRAELTTSRADVLGEVANELESIDFHPNAKATASDLCRLLAGRFRRKALTGLDAAKPDRCTCRKAVHLGHHTTPVDGCPWCADQTQTVKEA